MNNEIINKEQIRGHYREEFRKFYGNTDVKSEDWWLSKLEIAISTTQEQALAEYRGKIEKLSNKEGFRNFDEMSGYQKALTSVLSLLSDNKIEE